MIYLDQSSTSFPKAPGVGEAMKTFIEEEGVNIGRGNYKEAYGVENKIIDTRIRLSALFGHDDPRRVIFTPGVTFSLNLFFQGILKEGDHVVVSGMEHNAVMRPLVREARTRGIRYDIAPADRQGYVSPDSYLRALKKDTRAVITLHASNVSGTLLPIHEIGPLLRERGILFAVDAAQTAGGIPINMEDMKIDFLAFTGHKTLGGPQGIGGFLVTEELAANLSPLIVGGTGSRSSSLDQPDFLPDKFESGTMNLPGILGLQAALLHLEQAGLENLHRTKMALTARFLDGLKEIPGIRVAGMPGLSGRTSVVSLFFPDRDNALIAHELEKGWSILTRVGLHCAPMAHQSLETFPQGTVRFSFGASNTEKEIDTALEALTQLMTRS